MYRQIPPGRRTAGTNFSPWGLKWAPRPMPSPGPWTKCPPNSLPAVSGRSRLTMASGLSSPNEVRRRVSPERSALKVSSLSAATVRQQPLTAMLLETARNGTTPAARTVRRPPSAPLSSDFTKPRCSMIPVNMGQVSLDCQVRAEALNGNIFQSAHREAICKGKRHIRASSDFCRIKKEELVHYAGGKGGAVQSAPRFENHTEDIAFSQFAKDRFQIRPPALAVGLKDFDARLFQSARARILWRLRGYHQHVFIRRVL